MVAVEHIQQALAASLIYFYPVAHFARTFGPLIEKGVNTFEHQSLTSSSDLQVVTRANIDTVYSRAVIDLSENDVLMTIPEIPDVRTHIFPFHDFYGNSFAILGSFNNASEGSWRLTLGEPGQSAIEISDHGDSCDPDAVTGTVYFPTTYGSIFPRLLLLNEPDDQRAIADIQKKLTLQQIPRRKKDRHGKGASRIGKGAPRLTTDLINVSGLSPGSYLSPAAYDRANITMLLDVAHRLIKYNLPVSQEIVNDQVLRNLSIAGAKGKKPYSIPCNVNLDTVRALVQARLDAALADPGNYGAPSDDSRADWRWFERLGDFGLGFDWRAQITSQGYLGITTEQYLALIYTGGKSPIGAMSLVEGEAFVWTFNGRPPLEKPGGFWSLTVYNAEGFLVSNQYNRFGLGDRSNLTYANGEEVYPSGAREMPAQAQNENGDGSFQILLQSVDNPPPANWTSNWIPTPAESNATFFINIRLYGPTEELIDGPYDFPVRTKVDAISQ
ncbi:uncharacterized protein J7T54_005103 [Emericellopsis cladophorae]|uniref:DUF1254 domain-containing protein n=1 Tax=Emericellopsis cladophorae TaxID=2686198 RepID=A0A9P9Y2E0_9HYPO|nr:uncharacterized protein J7T54_005103 [Emericellopsis cladophorae]KAI6781893.1 hypothetical protein J7T54_005103 [Emericellopsis cladophorae]